MTKPPFLFFLSYMPLLLRGKLVQMHAPAAYGSQMNVQAQGEPVPDKKAAQDKFT